MVITLLCQSRDTGSIPVGAVLRLLVQLDKTLDFYSSVTGSSPVQPTKIYIVRLGVRTQLFHGWNTGSNPVRVIDHYGNGCFTSVAQLVEHSTDNGEVYGSSP